MHEHSDAKVIVALDFEQEQKAMNFVDSIAPDQCKLKVGKEMFTYFGPQFVGKLVNKGFDVFLDLKFHDIPNTVAKACIAAADLGVWMVNVHASGGHKMMEHTVQALNSNGKHRPLLTAVTVLTSMDKEQLVKLGIHREPQEQVLHLASLAKASGVDGVVCSAQESAMLKSELGKEFKLVTPGIRPVGSDVGDQKRIMTPEQAIKQGSDYLVIGRPITQSSHPSDTLESINHSL